MFINTFMLNSEEKVQPDTPRNQLSTELREIKLNRANPKSKRKKLEFVSLNLGGPQYQDRSSQLIAHLEQIIKLKQVDNDEQRVFFF